MKLKKIGGIFDDLIKEGIPAGSIIYFSIDPAITSEWVLYQLCGVRKTYYFVTERNPKRVEIAMKEAGINLENVEIIDFRGKKDPSKIISTIKQANDATLVIDAFLPSYDEFSPDLVKRMQEECEGREVLCFLVVPKGACDEIIARRIAYMCDVFFDLRADRVGEEIIPKFSVPKIRGISPLTKYMRLKIEANRVEIDTSRDIV
ncbi:MAG: RAD55 family ATPase [Candidatus Methanospirareceae archaeon]